MAPLYSIRVLCVKHGLAQGGAVNLEAEVMQVLIVSAAKGDEAQLMAMVEAGAIALEAGVGLPLLLNAVLAQPTQPASGKP